MTTRIITPGQILEICSSVATLLNENQAITLDDAQVALKNPNCAANIVAILKNRGELPNTVFGKLQTITVVDKGEVITGHDFVARSRETAKKTGRQTLGQEAYDFYKRKENWHLMPVPDSGINVVVFPEAQFVSGGSRLVHCLYRRGAEWSGGYYWLDSKFDDLFFAAVS